MEASTLTLGGLVYDLDPSTTISTLKASMERAAHSGGGFVDLNVIGEDSASVFVTSGTSIYFTTNDTAALAPGLLSPSDLSDWEMGIVDL
jgi:hypothetical protein